MSEREREREKIQIDFKIYEYTWESFFFVVDGGGDVLFSFPFFFSFYEYKFETKLTSDNVRV